MGTVTPLRRTPPMCWDDLAPCTHVVQLYGEDSAFLESLEGFVASALQAGESAIVIASSGHLYALERRMRQHGIDVAGARAERRYVAELAEELLDHFMVDGWPDEKLFRATVRTLLAAARGETNRPVRAFGEMVAILWTRGEYAATIHLELLWHELCRVEGFPVFCAYPRGGFSRNAVESIVEICRVHTKVVP